MSCAENCDSDHTYDGNNQQMNSSSSLIGHVMSDFDSFIHSISVYPLSGDLFDMQNLQRWFRIALLIGIVLSLVFLSWKPILLVLGGIVIILIVYYLSDASSHRSLMNPNDSRALQNGLYEQESFGEIPSDLYQDRNADNIPVFAPPHYGPIENEAPYSTGDLETDNPLVSAYNPMGNPNAYDFNTAVRMNKPKTVFYQKQEWADLYRPNGQVPDGLWLNPIPDPTFMAPGAVFFPESSEAGRMITSELGLGYSR